MEESKKSENHQPRIVEAIINAAKKAFDPSVNPVDRQEGLHEYNGLVERTQTWILLHALNSLIKPNTLPPWLRQPLMQTLTLLPLRPDGVRATMEFVFAVHPSNNGLPLHSDTNNEGKQGTAITQEAVAVATKLLSSVPVSMSPQGWFDGISGQLFDLFDGEAGPDIAKTAAQVVGFGILGKKQFGAPGAPGWNAFVLQLVEALNPSLKNEESMDISTPKADGGIEIVELRKDQVLVTAHHLEKALHRLELLIISNPSPGLCKRVLKPMILQLWALSSWPNASIETEQRVCKPARVLVQTYLKLFGDVVNILPFIKELTLNGSTEPETRWRYRSTNDGGIEIIKPQATEGNQIAEFDWNELESKSTALVAMITNVCTTEEVSYTFLHLLRGWMQTVGRQSGSSILISPQQEEPNSAVQELANVILLQKFMDKAPEKLVSHFDQLLELVSQVLRADSRSSLGDDLAGIVLSLLNLVITAPGFQKSDINPNEHRIVEESLERISGENRGDLSTTARNLAMLLKYRDEVEPPNDKTIAPTAQQIEDRKTYGLAMNYITGDGDSPPPVVSEGLNLLSGLIVAESSILDIPAVTVLMSNLLKDNEDYINLRVIKIFTLLANKHPNSTLQDLLEHYSDTQEKLTTDVRLRYGEAILQVIERLGETFAGEFAQNVGEQLLSVASRRGYRAKTMAKQARDEKLKTLKNQNRGASQEDDASAGVAGEDESLEDMQKSEILSQIVQGWESKRGSEDVRMRTSALSIFGSAIETNIAGIGPTVVSAGVDLSIRVLTMEPELEKGILRRAAILVMLSFVRALNKAKENGRSLGFGLTNESRNDIHRTLQYIAATDNDGLVRQHARDVFESLENWSMVSLLPSDAGASTAPGLNGLAGLRVNPDSIQADASGRRRLRIEEVD